MKIIIDGEEDLIQIKPGSNLNDAFAQIEQTLAAYKKIPEKIELNKEEFSIEDFSKKLETNDIKESDEVSITTSNLGAYLLTLIDCLYENLKPLEEQLIKIADDFLKMDNKDAMNELSQWCTDFDGLMINIQNLRLTFKVDLGEIKLKDESFDQAIDSMKNIIQQIIKGMEKDEKASVADMLEFEMTNYVADLKEVFPKIKSRIQDVFK